MDTIDDEDELLILCAYQILITGLALKRRRRSKRWLNRRWWVRPINVERPIYGDYDNLFQSLMHRDYSLFFRYVRMSTESFDSLLSLTTPFLTKANHRALLPEQRLAITLRYLGTGDQILSIALAFRCGESTVRKIIHETCAVIVKVLQPLELRQPTEEQWKIICDGFQKNWNFPLCLGAIDGKHVQIKAPAKSGSLFFNYKKTHSIVLLALCDHNYKFTLVDVGGYGGNSDGGIFASSEIHAALEEGTLNLPKGTANLPGSEERLPCFFVGDSGFPIGPRMMRPFSGKLLQEKSKIFNYRLSRARRIIENAFGILSARWRIYQQPINMHPKYVDTVVATVCLHNFLRSDGDEVYCPPSFMDKEDAAGNLVPGSWRREGVSAFKDIAPTSTHNSTRIAYKNRNILADYFVTPAGEVPWQYDYVRRGENRDTSA